MMPIRTSRPPRMVDWRSPKRGGFEDTWRGPWLTAGSGTTGALGGGPSGMPPPYPGSGCCQGSPAARRSHRRRGTEVVQHAFRAPRRSRHADPAAVQDQAQAEAGPLAGRDHLRYLGLDLDGIGAPGQPEPAREAEDVGGDGESGDAEGDPPQHV